MEWRCEKPSGTVGKSAVAQRKAAPLSSSDKSPYYDNIVSSHRSISFSLINVLTTSSCRTEAVATPPNFYRSLRTQSARSGTSPA